MTRHTSTILLIAVIVIAAIGALGYYATHAFELTGEEGIGPQTSALPQLVQNVVYPPLQLEPYAEIAHTDVNPYGINTFLHQEVEAAKREEQLRLIREAGFHWIRQEFPWQDIEIHGRRDFADRRNDPDGIDAWAKYDNIVALAEEYGVEIIARISSPPQWSRAQPEDVTGTFAPPDDFTDFANFAAALAERYEGRVAYFQIWNEPNIPPEWGNYPVNPEAYTELLCETYRAIKAANPDAVILSGALAPTGEIHDGALNDFIFLQRMYDAGAAECFDILSAQGYGLWSGPLDRRMRPLIINYGRNQFLRDIMVRNGDAEKAIWISEMNWNAAPEDVAAPYGRVTAEQQARYAPLAYQRAQEEWPWIGVIAFWYFKRADDLWLVERRPEAYFQMAEPDFTLLPVYGAMKAYTRQPPVMGIGHHRADHWAVEYGDGWECREGVCRVAQTAEPATFSFVGTSLKIVVGESNSGANPMSYRVDGRQPITAPPGSGEAKWYGWYGQHTVEMTPGADLTIIAYEVRNEAPVVIRMVSIAAVVLAGAAYALTRRLEP